MKIKKNDINIRRKFFLKSIKILNFFLAYCNIVIHEKKENFFYSHKFWGYSSNKTEHYWEKKDFIEDADFVISNNLTLLYYDRLFTIYSLLKNIIPLNIPKVKNSKIAVAEIGVYKGGVSFFINSFLSKSIPLKKFIVYSFDTFEGHSNKDLRSVDTTHISDTFFVDTSFETVSILLSRFKSSKVFKGRVQENAHKIKNCKFDLVHIDVDIFEPTLFSLQFFHKYLNEGGYILVDDYNFRTCPGAKLAVDKFMMKTGFSKYYFYELPTGQALLQKRTMCK